MKRRFLRTVKSCSNERCFGCSNERLLRAKRKAFCKWKTFGLRKRAVFSAYAKPTDKEKLFINTAKSQFSTAPKLTSNFKFYPRKLTVSLQYNNSFSKNISLASALQYPFRTGSKHPKKRVAPYACLGTKARNVTKKHNQ